MIGLAVGIVAGVVQYWLLSKFTGSITRGSMNKKDIALGLLQFFMPAAILIAMAFIRRTDLLWTAVGLTGCLILCAVTKFVVNKRRTRGQEDDNY